MRNFNLNLKKKQLAGVMQRHSMRIEEMETAAKAKLLAHEEELHAHRESAAATVFILPVQ